MSLNTEKIINEMFSLENSNYQDTDAREKNNDFLVEYSSTCAAFLVEIL